MSDEVIKWMECFCTAPEHAVRVSLQKWGDHSTDVNLIVSTQLRSSYLSLFQRIKLAIKILLGYEADCFAECVIADNSVNELSTLIVSYRLLKKLRMAKENK